MIGKTLKELGKALTEKKISSVELTQLHLDRIARLTREINAFITVDAQKGLAQARAADARLAISAARDAMAGRAEGGKILGTGGFIPIHAGCQSQR